MCCMMVILDALTLNKPEIFIGGCADKLDDKTGELKDDVTRNFLKEQLEAFAWFIARHGGKAFGSTPFPTFHGTATGRRTSGD
jgi:hypothetical protein